jgi:hypothetical protein
VSLGSVSPGLGDGVQISTLAEIMTAISGNSDLQHQAAQQVEVGGVTLGRQGVPSRTSLRSWQRLSDQRRATRLALYERVMALRAQGGTMKGIGRESLNRPSNRAQLHHRGGLPRARTQGARSDAFGYPSQLY